MVPNGGHMVSNGEAVVEILAMIEGRVSDGSHGVIGVTTHIEHAVGNRQGACGVGAVLVACHGDGLPIGVDGIVEVAHLEGGLGIRHSRQNHQQE